MGACNPMLCSICARLQANARAGLAGAEVTPLGLIGTAIGGSVIEEWTTNSTTAGCKNASMGRGSQTLWDSKVVPYLNMTVKGWLWYQGENNMHGVHGNSLTKTVSRSGCSAAVERIASSTVHPEVLASDQPDIPALCAYTSSMDPDRALPVGLWLPNAGHDR